MRARAAVLVAGAVLAASTAGRHAHALPAAPTQAAATAISYAQAQIGRPYLWGGTGPDAFDCSGLVMEAYASASVTIPRTSQEQWTDGTQVPASQVEPGDLVFFAGADGTSTSPGHVGLVTDPASHRMIDAYDAGTPIRYDTYGLPSSAEGLSDPVGFTDPAGGTS
jgi:cell wall-associated NlpC family hydrolase